MSCVFYKYSAPEFEFSCEHQSPSMSWRTMIWTLSWLIWWPTSKRRRRNLQPTNKVWSCRRRPRLTCRHHLRARAHTLHPSSLPRRPLRAAPAATLAPRPPLPPPLYHLRLLSLQSPRWWARAQLVCKTVEARTFTPLCWEVVQK